MIWNQAWLGSQIIQEMSFKIRQVVPLCHSGVWMLKNNHNFAYLPLSYMADPLLAFWLDLIWLWNVWFVF